MKNVLLNLSKLEIQVLNSIGKGIQHKEIFEKYRSIFTEYSKLANIDIEAYKRFIFLKWYEINEPNDLTGLSNLVIENFDQFNGDIDKELISMLDYYCNIGLGINTNLLPKEYNIKNNIDLEVVFNSIKSTDNRGQMGVYWKSILEK